MEQGVDLIVLGLNHKTAPLDVRERLAVREEEQGALALLARDAGCAEALLLSTCNRVELYGARGAQGGAGALEGALSLLASRAGLSAEELRPHMYLREGEEALHHLLRVAASLDSMVVGEPQILGQLKSSFERCREAGAAAGLLSGLMERVFAVAKRVRTQTGIGKSVVSISSVAVGLARQIFDDLSSRTALLVGAGEMGELAAQHLKQEGVTRLWVANRSLERAAALAERLGGQPRGLSELPELLAQADIVITSTGAHGYLVTKDLVARALRARKYRPLFLIDISVPRNVEPSVNELENVYVYDVDDLNGIADENRALRAREAEEAERMVREEVERLRALGARRELGPLLGAVRERVHALKEQELAWAQPRLADLTPAQQKVVSQLAERLANKVLHQALTGLKSYAEHPDRDVALRVAEELFGVGGQAEVGARARGQAPAQEQAQGQAHSRSDSHSHAPLGESGRS